MPTKLSLDENDGVADTLGDVLDFMRLLWAVDHRLQTVSKRMEQQLGITGPQRLAIRLIGKYPKVSAGRLAQLMQIHPSTLTGILRRLELRGALQRLPDPVDGRRALFQLTAIGEKLNTTREGTVEDCVSRALASLSSDHVAGARETLISLARALEPPESEDTSLQALPRAS